KLLPRCSLVMRPHASRAKMSSARRNPPRTQSEKPEPRKRSTAPRFTLFKPYWLIYRPSFETPSPRILRVLRLGNKRQNPRPFSKGPLICSKTFQPRSQYREPPFRPQSFINAGSRSFKSSKFSLADRMRTFGFLERGACRTGERMIVAFLCSPILRPSHAGCFEE